MRTPPTEKQIEQVRRSFKRCREGTVDAIIDLQRTCDPESVPTIVRGIVWRYVHKDVQSIVDQTTAETPLASLGIDSLTMMEIVLDVQDALNVTIEDADLKKMKTIGDLIGFLQKHYAEVHRAG